VKPENVLPRVRSHLEMIGESEPWEPLWISIYNAKCLTLPNYRHGRVFFAGDAAHLVPIFGVRGLNSGLDDAGNLAWKLARVQRGESPDALLDSYSVERVHATRENIAYGAKSTEFMAPPDFAFRLMREAALRLARDDEAVRPLINPRQSSAIGYTGSPLDGGQSGGSDAWAGALAAPGAPAPEALLRDALGKPFHLSTRFGRGFVALVFNGAPDGGLPRGVESLPITPDTDTHSQAWRRYGLQSPGEPALVLVRPDGYVLGRWHGLDTAPLRAALQSTGVTP
jgi:3-(3-hydroxy-phenyl)propionate hydroxylase